MQSLLGQNEDQGETDDGLEAGICFINPEKKQMTFAGARFSLWRANQKGVIEIKGDRKGMGYRRYPQVTSFTDFTFSFEDRNTFYLTTDGLIDQIGARVAARSASGVSWTCSRRIAGFPWASRRSSLWL